MTINRKLIPPVIGLVLGCAVLPAGADAYIPSADALRDQAMEAYDRGHYAVAARRFASAAELGDGRSAETLALMYRYGERFYGDQIRRDPREAAGWAELAARARFGLTLSGGTHALHTQRGAALSSTEQP